ncbi:hypothetical protein ES703_78649 [subsurface metagenome]
MKKERKIIIKNPKLQAIRNNLRKIIVLATDDEWWRLNHQERLYSNNRDATRNTPSQRKRMLDLLNKRYELNDYLKRSICRCFSGNHCPNKTELGDSIVSLVDMVYAPYMGAWYCVDCYERIEQKWKFHEHHRKEFICELKEGATPSNSRLIEKISQEVLNGEVSPKEAYLLLQIGSVLEKDRELVRTLLARN